MSSTLSKKPWIKNVARVGLIAKGFVYVLLGVLAFMAAFEIGGHSGSKTTKSGVFDFIKDWPAGNWLLSFLAVGLICYSVWRAIQGFITIKQDETKKKDERLEKMKGFRYLFSSMTYLFIAFTAIKIVLEGSKKNGDKNQDMAAQLMDMSFGQWLLGILALIMFGNGIYQAWYGLSEKYKKHVEKLKYRSGINSLLLHAGKVGYLSRAAVWFMISYLLMRAAIHAKSSEAGDTGKAFQFIENSPFGSYLLGAIGFGLVLYGGFNFIRARYEKF